MISCEQRQRRLEVMVILGSRQRGLEREHDLGVEIADPVPGPGHCIQVSSDVRIATIHPEAGALRIEYDVGSPWS
jgi:hypothetical protein